MDAGNRNLILCGFMGCGKSTVGRLLARETGRRFVDMDSYIEGRAHKTVARIFAEDGEPCFRALEREAARLLAREQGLVIASGGGTLVCSENAACLRATGLVLLLDVPLDILRARLRYDASRPLLQKPNRDEAMAALFAQRLPLYRAAADMEIPAAAAPAAVVRQIREAVGL